jgi:hypothetical protein
MVSKYEHFKEEGSNILETQGISYLGDDSNLNWIKVSKSILNPSYKSRL